jgi:hypothetical protein
VNLPLTLPWSDDVETTLLGNLLLAPERFAEHVSKLSSADFFSPERRSAFEAMCSLHERGEPIEAPLLIDELTRRDSKVKDPRSLIWDLNEAATTASSIPGYIRRLRDLTGKRNAVQLAEQIFKVASNGQGPEALASFGERLLEIAQGTDAGEIRLEPLDLRALLEADPQPVQYLLPPHLPVPRRVVAFGPAASGKSMWAMWAACKLSREGHHVLYISQENPLDEDVRRLRLLRPDPAYFHFVHAAGLDLRQPGHAAVLLEVARGMSLVVIDTVSACWSGDENDNAAYAAFDRDVLAPTMNETGATILLLDHTGNPQAFVRRKGVYAGRGASSKAQKADVVLVFEPRGEHEFVLECPKLRGAAEPPAVLLRIVDTDDGLDIDTVGDADDVKVSTVAAAMVDVIYAEGALPTNDLRKRTSAFGGKEVQTEAMRLLKFENPARVKVAWDVVDTGRGRQRAKVWRPAEPELLPETVESGDEE